MIFISYLLYILLSSSIVLWVGNFCYQNGKIYVENYFPKQIDFANRINRLLRLAYYLLNIGLAIICLYSIENIETIEMMIKEVSVMIGFILLIIGILHFNNIVMIYLIHKHYKN